MGFNIKNAWLALMSVFTKQNPQLNHSKNEDFNTPPIFVVERNIATQTQNPYKHLAHSYLKKLCNVKCLHNSISPGKTNAVTERVSFLMSELHKSKIRFTTDFFGGSHDSAGFVNIEVPFIIDRHDAETVILIAHHDINNTSSQNCNDNSASVSILLAFCNHLKQLYLSERLNNNVVVVWTDCEEFGGRGSNRLGKKIVNSEFGNVKYVVNLELTAIGDKFWMSPYLDNSELVDRFLDVFSKRKDKLSITRVPFNDSVILAKFGIDTVCFGILPSAEMDMVNNGTYCPTWALCHREDDTIEKSNADDMDSVVKLLEELI